MQTLNSYQIYCPSYQHPLYMPLRTSLVYSNFLTSSNKLMKAYNDDPTSFSLNIKNAV